MSALLTKICNCHYGSSITQDLKYYSVKHSLTEIFSEQTNKSSSSSMCCMYLCLHNIHGSYLLNVMINNANKYIYLVVLLVSLYCHSLSLSLSLFHSVYFSLFFAEHTPLLCSGFVWMTAVSIMFYYTTNEVMKYVTLSFFFVFIISFHSDLSRQEWISLYFYKAAYKYKQNKHVFWGMNIKTKQIKNRHTHTHNKIERDTYMFVVSNEKNIQITRAYIPM